MFRAISLDLLLFSVPSFFSDIRFKTRSSPVGNIEQTTKCSTQTKTVMVNKHPDSRAHRQRLVLFCYHFPAGSLLLSFSGQASMREKRFVVEAPLPSAFGHVSRLGASLSVERPSETQRGPSLWDVGLTCFAKLASDGTSSMNRTVYTPLAQLRILITVRAYEDGVRAELESCSVDCVREFCRVDCTRV